MLSFWAVLFHLPRRCLLVATVQRSTTAPPGLFSADATSLNCTLSKVSELVSMDEHHQMWLVRCCMHWAFYNESWLIYYGSVPLIMLTISSEPNIRLSGQLRDIPRNFQSFCLFIICSDICICGALHTSCCFLDHWAIHA